MASARPAAAGASGSPAQYAALAPIRILDTRTATGGHPLPLGPNQALQLGVAGKGGVPADRAAAITVNVTVTNTTASSYLTLYPSSGAVRPEASSLNFGAGQVLSNLVTVSLGPDGGIGIYNSAGQVDVIVDLEGYYASPINGTEGLFRPLPPTRIVDSRNGTGGVAGRLAANQSITFAVAGRGGVPAAGAVAAVLNLTAIAGTESSYLTAYPASAASRPEASTVNFAAGRNLPNRAIVKLGAGGQVSVYNSAGSADLAVDVTGWFTDGSDGSATGGTFTGVSPTRLLDTRSGNGAPAGRLAGTHSLSLVVAGRGGVPASGAGAALLNLAVTNPSEGSFLTAYPGGGYLPLASDLNFGPSETIANLAAGKLGPDGRLELYSAAGLTDVIADLAGWYSDAPAQGTPPGAPAVAGVSVVSKSQVAISWSAPASSGSGTLVSYTIIAEPGGRQWATAASVTSATVGSLQCGVTYTFQVAASNVGGGSGPASAASAPVTPECPTSNVIQGVPWYHQKYSLTCEAASLQMLLAHQGVNADQDQIMAVIGIDWRPAYYDASGLRWGNPYTSFVGNPSGSEYDLTGYGTYHSAIAGAATRLGGRVLRNGEGISPQELYQAILDDHPVVAWVTWDWAYHGRQDYTAFDGQRIVYAGPIEHGVAIVGVTPDSLLIDDPDRSPYWLSKSTFESSYASYNQMAVIMA